MSIFGSAAKRAGFAAKLAIVDGFAGRGKYLEDKPGSPLLLRDIAAEIVGAGRAETVDLFLVERDPQNCEMLRSHLARVADIDGVNIHGPACCSFVTAAEGVIQKHLNPVPRPSFWFLDPFGFTGVPLTTIKKILERRFSEVFITFMVRDINRFLSDDQHRAAVSEILGLHGPSLKSAVDEICASQSRELALRDLYERRLLEDGGAKYVWPFRVASRGADDTVYYLIHASTAPKALREMKKATHGVGGWQYAFLGRDDFTTRAQLEIPEFGPDDTHLLGRQLLTVFAGQELAYERLLDVAVPDRRFFWWIDKHFHEALTGLVSDKQIRKTSITTKGARGLQRDDLLSFPPMPPLT